MENKKESNQNLKLAFSLIAIVLILWILSWVLITIYLEEWSNRGTFGDMFGAINSLFSGLAFAGLLYTIYLQSKELSLQRQELQETRQELEGQKLQLEQQNENMKKQNFEITFFNMLKNLQSIVNNMVDSRGIKKGHIYLHDLFEEFRIAVSNKLQIERPSNKELLKKIIIEKYNSFFVQDSFNLGHFYRTTHNLLKMIEDYSLDIKIRRKYSSIFQAQLSNDELGFILYNSLSDFSLNKKGKPEFHRMVDELNILENINEKYVFDKSIVDFFPNTNFFFMRNDVV